MVILHAAKVPAPVAPRLVVEDSEQRKRIVASTHDGSHFGLNRTNDMVASKYYWPGLFTDVKTYVSFTSLHTYIVVLQVIMFIHTTYLGGIL